MRKVLALAALLTANFVRADDPAIPLTITGGFNADIVANGTNSAGTSVSGAFDAADNVFFDSTYDSSHGNNGGALPTGSTLMDSGGNHYSLASATGNNALVLGPGGSGTLTLDYGSGAALTGLLFLGASADGDTLLDYTLHFAGEVTVSGSFTLANWFDPAANGTFTSFNRITTYDDFNSEQNRIFSLYAASAPIPEELMATRLESITFAYGAGNVDSGGIFPRAAILGVSAFDPIIVVPEPSTSSLMLGGVIALATLAGRKFFKS
jgi:hypothetical protein